MSQRYFIGVDGGATKTKCVVCDADLKVLGVGLAEGSNQHIIGSAAAQANIAAAMRAALENASIGQEQITAIGLGMAGIDSPEDKAALEAVLVKLGIPIIALDNDGMAALSGATSGQPGVVVIAGTGAIAFGINAQGEKRRAGGWGYIVGDEGSAYDIGRRGLVAALWAYDGRGPETALLARMNNHYRFHTIRDLIHMVYDEKLPHHQIAAFARIVAAVALEGDQAAQKILQQAGEVLALSALAVLKRLGMEDIACQVAAAGSVLENDRIVRRSFVESLQKQAPQAIVIAPRHEAAVGAALMAISEYRKRAKQQEESDATNKDSGGRGAG